MGNDESPEALFRQLRRAGLITTDSFQWESLAGGVSSEIYRIKSEDRVFVVKRALEKLKVEADWRADTSRNLYEIRFLEYVGSMLPDAVPRILHAGDGYFAMEYLGEDFILWKQQLLSGEFDPGTATRVGEVMGEVHRASTGDPVARARFDSLENFKALRISPYLETIAERHASIRKITLDECARLAATKECLVHGDLSPKNILHKDGRVVLLDCEVAWYGDPAFDLAFLLTHLCLKGLYHAPNPVKPTATLAHAFLEAYHAGYGSSRGRQNAIEERTERLLLMLMLARVDGKSPVEYLQPGQQQLVREFCLPRIQTGNDKLESTLDDWISQLVEPGSAR